MISSRTSNENGSSSVPRRPLETAPPVPPVRVAFGREQPLLVAALGGGSRVVRLPRACRSKAELDGLLDRAFGPGASAGRLSYENARTGARLPVLGDEDMEGMLLCGSEDEPVRLHLSAVTTCTRVWVRVDRPAAAVLRLAPALRMREALADVLRDGGAAASLRALSSPSPSSMFAAADSIPLDAPPEQMLAFLEDHPGLGCAPTRPIFLHLE